MTLILLLMAVGILLGFLVFSRPQCEKALCILGHVQQIATVVLLFSMGIWLGGNEDFWQNIRSIGLYGLLFAVLGIAGSIIGVLLLTRCGAQRRKEMP